MNASERGVGVVLSQLDESGADHPVAYFSRKLLLRKQRYSTVEKECLAISSSAYKPRKALYSTNGPSDTTVAGSSEGEAMPDSPSGVHPSSHTNLSWPTSLVTRKVMLTDSLEASDNDKFDTLEMGEGV